MPGEGLSSQAPAPEQRNLAVVVVNFRTHELVDANIARTVGPGFAGHVLVVDNYSDDAERRAITEVCSRRGWELLPLDHNAGFGGGVNHAARRAVDRGATALLLLNPDAWLEPEAVTRLLARVRSDPLVLVSPVVVRPDGALYSADVDLHLGTGEMVSTRRRPAGTSPNRVHRWVSGACLMLSVRLWLLAGGFDEDYFLYWEDVDLCRRAVEAGGRIEVAEDLVAVHAEGQSHEFTGSPRAKSPLYYYYNTRNRLMYAAKHLDRADQRRWVRATPRVSYRILLQGGRRQFVHPGRTFWPALRGSIGGVRYLRRHGRSAARSPGRA